MLTCAAWSKKPTFTTRSLTPMTRMTHSWRRRIMSTTGEDFAESGMQQKQHFTSYERDAESGTDYAINRRHQPAWGRFMQADPYRASGGAGQPQSWNRYVYAGNDPVNFNDPAGLTRMYVVLPCWLSESCTNAYWGIDVPDSNSSPEDGMGAGTDWQKKAFKESVEKAKKILGKDTECSKFFGENAVAALEALEKLWEFKNEGLTTNTGIRQIYDISHTVNGPDGTPAYRVPTQVMVFTNGPLFLGTRGPGLGRYDRGSEGARIIAILHEVAHNIITNQTGPPAYLIPSDGDDPDKSVKNTNTILKHCSQEVFDAIK
jgi:RHS repeat-associated protein